MPKVTVIPSTVNPMTHLPKAGKRKRRVAGYARVSTDSDEQFTSYQSQVDYYTKMIEANPEWEFVRVYADEGISGTSTKNRVGFNTMIKDAMAGRIDLIVTKSVSRFARNTVDSITTIRRLKEKGVECFFEKENIYTFDSKGELLITIMSSLAQEESRSISENVTWGARKSMSDGKVSVAYSSFLGYRKGKDGRMEIDEEQAETVRSIYRWFMKGLSYKAICEKLMGMGVKTPMNKDIWRPSTVLSILSNEKYKGDALLQKTYTTDFLTHKHKKNAGEVQQYYVEKHHEAIIPEGEWEMAQFEIERRSNLSYKYSGDTAFSSRIFCADCGTPYGPKVWHSTDRYRKVIWQCNAKFRKGCSTPTLTEAQIKDAFVKAYNEFSAKRKDVLGDVDILLSAIDDPSTLDAPILAQTREATAWADQVRKLVDENAKVARDQAEFQREYAELSRRFEEENAKLEGLKAKKAELASRRKKLEAFVEGFMKQPEVLNEWAEDAWRLTVDKADVGSDGTITFNFKDGTKIGIPA